MDGGQPFLTQRLCKLLAENGANPESVDALVSTHLLGEKARGDPHFQFVANMLIQGPAAQKDLLFETHLDILKGRRIACDDQSPVHNRLRLSGIVKKKDGGLSIRNELYQEAFGQAWVKGNARPSGLKPTNAS